MIYADIERVTELQREIVGLQDALTAAVASAWPVGKRVRWIKNGKYPQSGNVILHGEGDRLKVRNEITHKALWITVYDIECARRYESSAGDKS